RGDDGERVKYGTKCNPLGSARRDRQYRPRQGEALRLPANSPVVSRKKRERPFVTAAGISSTMRNCPSLPAPAVRRTMPSDVWPILRLSILVAGAAVSLAAIIGIPAGLWLGRGRRRGRDAAWAVVYTGMALPPVVVGLIVYLLLSRSG